MTSLAIAISVVASWPASSFAAASKSQRRDVSTAIFMSTTLCAIAWKAPSGLPNCSRSRACSMQRASRRPIAPALVTKESRISHFITWSSTKNPAPGLPITLAAGTTQPSSTSSPTGEPFRPSLPIGSLVRSPGVSRSTTNAVIPSGPPSGRVRA